MPVLRFALAVVLVAMGACGDGVVAPEQPCDPTAQTHPDSMRVVRDSLGNPILIIQWCGPITVE